MMTKDKVAKLRIVADACDNFEDAKDLHELLDAWEMVEELDEVREELDEVREELGTVQDDLRELRAELRERTDDLEYAEDTLHEISSVVDRASALVISESNALTLIREELGEGE